MRILRVAATVLLAVLMVGEARARCTDRPLSQTVTRVKDFLIRPEGLLERFPAGEESLSFMVSEIIRADPNATLDPVVKLLRSANGSQRRAIGVGLGNAARLCIAGSDTGTARLVQEIVRRQNDSILNLGFVSASTERSSFPPLPSPSLDQERQNALGRSAIANPRTDPFKSSTLPSPFAPRNLAPP